MNAVYQIIECTPENDEYIAWVSDGKAIEINAPTEAKACQIMENAGYMKFTMA